MTPELSIVIVSYDAKSDLEACLASLTVAPPLVRHQIVVVDNGSSDNSAEAVRRQWPGVQVIDNGANLGFSRANNIGIRATAGNMLLLLNSDTLVPAGAVDALVQALLAHPECAVAGPRLVSVDGIVELSFGRMIGPWSELRQKVRVYLHQRETSRVRRSVERETRRLHHPDWVSGACLLVWRTDAEAVGLLDERYFMYAEDVDLCAAIRARGRRILFTPAAEIVHRRGRSRAAAAAATEAHYRRSQIAFYRKHHPRWAPLLTAYLALRGQRPPLASNADTLHHS